MKKTQPIKDRLNDHLAMLERLAATRLEIQYVYGSIKGLNFSGMPGGGDKRTSEEERLYMHKEELEEKAARQQAEIDRDWAELEELIEQLSPIETLVMTMRYRYGEEWSDVCFAIFGKRSDYEIEVDSYQNKMFKAHGRALCSLANMMQEREVTE